MKKTSFQDGDIFALPLKAEFGGGYACVVVLRKAVRAHKVILGGIVRRWRNRPKWEDVRDLQPDDQIVISVCISNDELRNGAWRRLGTLEDFSHEKWPTPATYDEGWVSTLATPDTWWFPMPVEKIELPRKIRKYLLHRMSMPHVLAEGMSWKMGMVLEKRSTPYWDWRDAVKPFTHEHRAAWAFVNEQMSTPVKRSYARRRSR
jgi:hypothetical protein